MKIERFEVPGLAQYSYVVSDRGQAAVVDPIRDVDRYLRYAAQFDLTFTHILETHIHADFASGATALAQATGAQLALSAHDQGEHYVYAMPHSALRDGRTIEIGATRIQALHTPGHTPEHLSFLVFDSERSSTSPAALLSGDFLFVGSLGRPDLLGDDAKEALAHDLFTSLHTRIANLPDSVKLYPGHGAGSLCGAGMSDRAESTLGDERATNPLFHLNEEDFIAAILASVPPMPSYYPRMKTLNSAGAPILPEVPGGRALSIAELSELARRGAALLDLRRPEAFGGAHIPGSINIGASGNISLWAGWLLDPAQPIVLIGDGGDETEARLALVRVGLDAIAGVLSGGIAAWIDAGLPLARTPQVATADVEACPADALLLDVRSDTEWDEGHIAGARHIMLGDLQGHLPTLPRNRSIVAICGSGYRSSIAASILAHAGFADTASLAGGMGAWNRRGLPVATGPDAATV